MNKLRGSIAAGLVLFLLQGCGPSVDVGPTENDLLAFEQAKADMLAKIEEQDLSLPESVMCTARSVSDETVETSYRIFLYERGDLTTEAEREAASADVLGTYETTCDGDIIAMANQLQGHGDTVHKGFVTAMLMEGR